MKKILVHCCCGPCATSSIRTLLDDGYCVVLTYENSNIWPEEENEKRYSELLKVADYYNGLEVVRGVYNHELWLQYIKGLENEPEHGKRCLKCFDYNLKRAYETAVALEIPYFTTTLTVSRFKKSFDIFKTGEKYPGFVPIDFKKHDGFSRSVRMSEDLGLYRQKYCGCEFSIPKEDAENA